MAGTRAALLAITALAELRVHHVFLGAAGIMPDGIYNSNTILVDTQRQMMKVALNVVVLADRTKFGKPSLSRLCGLNEISRIVTDSGLADEQRAMIRRVGAELIMARADVTEPLGLTMRGTA